MNTLVLFDSSRCVEFSPHVLPSELPFAHSVLSLFAPDTPLAEQISLPPDLPVNLTDDLTALLSESEPASFSTRLTGLVRVGGSPRDHIQLHDSAAVFALHEGYLTVMDQSGVYLNGEKISCGEYPLAAGDRIWAGSSRFVRHEGYITCTGTQYHSRLNLCTFFPQVYEDFPVYMRSPRIIKREPAESVELTPPEPREERKKGELFKVIIPPLVMAMVTAGGGILMGRGIFVLISAAAMLLSMVFSATSFISDNKIRKEKEKERDDSYDRYLLTQRKQIYRLYETQRDSLLYHNLSPKEIEEKILSYSSRLYERSANDSDFLTLSLGYSTVPASFRLKYNSQTPAWAEDPLVEEMRGLGVIYQNIPDMPTVIDLKQAHLGLVGEKANIHRQLAAILTQLCFFQSYHDIEIILLVEEEDRPKFEWARWYPHCRIKSINVTGLVSAENQRDQVLGNIAQVLKARRQKQEEEKKDSRYLPHYIFIIDNPKLIINHSIMEYLQTSQTVLGFSLIYTTHIQANLPENIQTVFILDGGEHGTLLLNEGVLLKRPVILPAVEEIDLEIMARKLAPIRHSQGISTQIPENVTFFGLYNVKRPEEIPVLHLWEKNACHKSLAVPLGLRGKDDLVFLNLHEKAHGPHGLVAGTTGSGKSEIVQSYILSLAVNFHPHEVGFLLIDYKGGGMANLFADLPHLLGTITNLDGSESMRALASIKSE
ncbi:MAG: type VII secretion protein EssC, partial [Clostridiales bacterium]|nr:type VII secretion protein EssC [Clostridiales bacterium]